MKEEFFSNVVSVIIPVYNGERFLTECLDSVIGQTYRDLEIIIIDDGSTDNSYEICKKYAEKDERIRLIRQENAGVSAARNFGLLVSQGEYIIFVDSDDMLTCDAVEILHGEMTKDTDYVIASHRDVWKIKSVDIVRKKGTYNFARIKSDIAEIDELLYSPWAKLYKRSIIYDNEIRFNTKLPLGEDHTFNLAYCKKAGNTKIIDNIVYEYRRGGMATTVRYYPDRCKISIAILDAYCELYDGIDNVPVDFLTQMVSEQLLGCAEHYLGHNKYSKACRKMEESMASFRKYWGYIDENHTIPQVKKYVKEGKVEYLLLHVLKEKWIHIVYKKIKKYVISNIK